MFAAALLFLDMRYCFAAVFSFEAAVCAAEKEETHMIKKRTDGESAAGNGAAGGPRLRPPDYELRPECGFDSMKGVCTLSAENRYTVWTCLSG